MLATGQSRLSFHLKALKDAGIRTDRREGRWIYYSLNPKVLEEAEQYVRSLRTQAANSGIRRDAATDHFFA
jgi:ArsR family transcriptional regulator